MYSSLLLSFYMVNKTTNTLMLAIVSMKNYLYFAWVGHCQDLVWCSTLILIVSSDFKKPSDIWVMQFYSVVFSVVLFPLPLLPTKYGCCPTVLSSCVCHSASWFKCSSLFLCLYISISSVVINVAISWLMNKHLSDFHVLFFVFPHIWNAAN